MKFFSNKKYGSKQVDSNLERIDIELKSLKEKINSLESDNKILDFKINNPAEYTIGEYVGNILLINDGIRWNDSMKRFYRYYDTYNKVSKQYRSIDEHLIKNNKDLIHWI